MNQLIKYVEQRSCVRVEPHIRDALGNVEPLRSSCKPGKAARRHHRCRNHRYIFWELHAEMRWPGPLIFVPASYAPTGATPARDAAGGNVGALRRANHGRGKGNEAKKASWAAVKMSHSGESCRRHAGRLVGERSDSGADHAGRTCCDSGSDRPTNGVSDSFPRIWIRDSDSECSRSERKTAASEAVYGYSDHFAFRSSLLVYLEIRFLRHVARTYLSF